MEWRIALQNDLVLFFDYGTEGHLRIQPELVVDWPFAEPAVYRSWVCRLVLAWLRSGFPLAIESPWLVKKEWKEAVGVKTQGDDEGRLWDRQVLEFQRANEEQ